MKVFVLALFIAAAASAPAPLDEETGEPVELIVNGIADGEPLEIGDVLDLKLKEHVNGEIVSSTNLLYPLTAAGIAEAAAAAEIEAGPGPVEEIATLPELVDYIPEPVELPEAPLPEVVPESGGLPDVALPIIIPDAIEQPDSEDVPVPGLPGIPQPHLPEMPEISESDLVPAETLPEPAPQHPTGEVFNDGIVQVTVNAPQPELFATVQSWFNMVLNYFNGEAQTTHQIV